MKQAASLFALITVLGLTSVAVQATPIVYQGSDVGASARPIPNSDVAAGSFDTALIVGSDTETLFTFEALGLGAFTNLSLGSNTTMNGTDFASNPQTISNTPSCSGNLCGFNTTLGGSKFAVLGGGTLTFSFSTPVNAFGAYIGGVQLGGETITFSDGSAQTVNIPNLGANAGMMFLGFTDFGLSISSVTINAPGDIISVDDVRIGRGAAVSGVPEPSTFVLIGSALGGLALLRRRSLRQSRES